MNWYVYIILCSDNSLYTGITNDMVRRWHLHAKQRGAKYFRGRTPKQLVYFESGHTRSTASKKEVLIKNMKRSRKLQLIQTSENEISSWTNFNNTN